MNHLHFSSTSFINKFISAIQLFIWLVILISSSNLLNCSSSVSFSIKGLTECIVNNFSILSSLLAINLFRASSSILYLSQSEISLCFFNISCTTLSVVFIFLFLKSKANSTNSFSFIST